MELERRSSAGSYSDQQRKIQQMRRGARFGMSCDDISLDVITISRWLSADEAKRERRSDVVLRFSRWFNVDDVIGDVIQSQESAGSLHSRRKRKRRRRGDPVASYSAISRCYLEKSDCKTMRRPKLNQLEHNNLADDEDQLQALKSKVNQLQELQLKIQQMRRSASYGMSCDDISLDVITISRRSKAQTLKRRRIENQQMKRSAKEDATSC
ncbi:hypothetical protein F511_23352 [Dorcoceras hygrometricum]|uniref:Uncharacterized protein n=1 Tax=Dorcoceras hygrometricum TaxID=472368 RepID=A0A2Z7CYB3_9LAMI|nr:hypothetical protein F511_23352 [Dorcoceras hygrometricum]